MCRHRHRSTAPLNNRPRYRTCRFLQHNRNNLSSNLSNLYPKSNNQFSNPNNANNILPSLNPNNLSSNLSSNNQYSNLSSNNQYPNPNHNLFPKLNPNNMLLNPSSNNQSPHLNSPNKNLPMLSLTLIMPRLVKRGKWQKNRSCCRRKNLACLASFWQANRARFASGLGLPCLLDLLPSLSGCCASADSWARSPCLAVQKDEEGQTARNKQDGEEEEGYLRKKVAVVARKMHTSMWLRPEAATDQPRGRDFKTEGW